MRKLIFLCIVFVSIHGYAQIHEHDFSFSAAGDQQIALGRYEIGTAINILCHVEGGWAEVGGNYEITSNWGDQPRLLYKGESAGDRLKFYAYVDPSNPGSMFLFATWVNQSPSKSHNNILRLHVSTMGQMDVNATGSFVSATELQTILSVNSSALSVGIGTTTPSKKLDITAGGEGILSLANGSLSGAGSRWDLNIVSGNTLLIGRSGVANDLAITSDGKIGIGTISPQAQLAVNGDIFSKKVKVTQTGWPDYVFHPSYKLPSLKEVEEFIKKHQHLHDVPSAKEVEANGLDLGDNQAVLLKKIEELTLYIIEQDKKIEELSEIKKDLEIIKAKLKN